MYRFYFNKMITVDLCYKLVRHHFIVEPAGGELDLVVTFGSSVYVRASVRPILSGPYLFHA